MQFTAERGRQVRRAVVLIGVARCGLPALPAVPAALAAMRGWATQQGIPNDLVVELSDEDGSPVKVADVFDAVSGLTARLTVEQLVIFFCGHGVYNDGTDLWLLSGAPGSSHEAVNVAKTVRLATRGTVPYVVLVADACRSATTTVQLSELTGAAVFPNPDAAGRQNEVDHLAACRLEDVATQIASPDDPTRYHPLYSEVLAEVLEGVHSEILETETRPEGSFAVVRAHALRRALPGLVALRIDELGKSATVSQVPVATVTSDPSRWVARLPLPAGAEPRRGVDSEWMGALPEIPDPALAAAAEASERLVTGWCGDLGDQFLDRPSTGVGIVGVVGAEPVRAYSPAGPAELAGARVFIPLDGRRAAPVLLEVEGGRCAVVPVLAGEVGLVTFEEGRLVDERYVSVEEAVVRAEIRAERSRVAAATRFGLAWWEYLPPGELVDRRPDVGLAVYLAYALDVVGDEHTLLRMLPSDLNEPVAYDLAMLTDTLPDRRTLTPWPMLTRGWALLGPDGLVPRPDVPPRVASPWTLFAGGFEHLRDHLDALE